MTSLTDKRKIANIPFFTWLPLAALAFVAFPLYSQYTEIAEVHYDTINNYLAKEPRDMILFNLARSAMHNGNINGMEFQTLLAYLAAKDGAVEISTIGADHTGAKERLTAILAQE